MLIDDPGTFQKLIPSLMQALDAHSFGQARAIVVRHEEYFSDSIRELVIALATLFPRSAQPWEGPERTVIEAAIDKARRSFPGHSERDPA